ncbi:ABC transporter permease [Salinactinospora qingdaonensis]|uniref:ABC transporter permease n=1 Tax=Salinactinospora qingdaonensis TaxID=702744 RepID=A0ABP7F5G1_9ACTN
MAQTPETAPTHEDGRASRRDRWRFARRFLSHRGAVVATGFLGLVGVVAVIGPAITPHDPLAQDLGAVLQPPSATHLLGTDDVGRDLFSRLIVATRTSLVAVLLSVAIGAGIGVPLGLIAALAQRTGGLLMRVTDGIMAFPPILLAIGVIGVLGPGLTQAMVAVGVVFVPRFARLTRTSVRHVARETYIEASRVIGTPLRRVVMWHILPNITGPIVVQIAVASGFAMLAEAGLSFLGLGVQPPDSSWGALLGRALPYINTAWWLGIAPGVFITATVLATNVVADGIGDSLGRETRRDA